MTSKKTNKTIDRIIKYITRQNFDGSSYYLKKNILNYLKQLKNERKKTKVLREM